MYAFIDSNRGRYTVGMMARGLRISPRSYYRVFTDDERLNVTTMKG